MFRLTLAKSILSRIRPITNIRANVMPGKSITTVVNTTNEVKYHISSIKREISTEIGKMGIFKDANSEVTLIAHVIIFLFGISSNASTKFLSAGLCWRKIKV
jgi:hypothetical protein